MLYDSVILLGRQPEKIVIWKNRTSLVPRLDIHLPKQRTWIWSLIQEDSTYYRATKCICHNHWACVLQLPIAVHPTACALQQEKPLQWEAHALELERSVHSPPLEKAYVQQWRPSTARKKERKKNFLKRKICTPNVHCTHSSVLAWTIPGTGEPGGDCRLWGHTELNTTDVT